MAFLWDKGSFSLSIISLIAPAADKRTQRNSSLTWEMGIYRSAISARLFACPNIVVHHTILPCWTSKIFRTSHRTTTSNDRTIATHRHESPNFAYRAAQPDCGL
jgi:hypothetical protein